MFVVPFIIFYSKREKSEYLPVLYQYIIVHTDYHIVYRKRTYLSYIVIIIIIVCIYIMSGK